MRERLHGAISTMLMLRERERPVSIRPRDREGLDRPLEAEERQAFDADREDRFDQAPVPRLHGAGTMLIERAVSIRPRFGGVRPLEAGAFDADREDRFDQAPVPRLHGAGTMLFEKAVPISPGGAGPPRVPEPKLVTLPARGRS